MKNIKLFYYLHRKEDPLLAYKMLKIRVYFSSKKDLPEKLKWGIYPSLSIYPPALQAFLKFTFRVLLKYPKSL